MSDSIVYALHGFLGLPSDWDFLKPRPIQALNILNENNPSSLESWAKKFNDSVLNARLNSKKILVGYSMGGRLAFHALLDRPSLWDAAVIISAHPGLSLEDKRNDRLNKDKKWSTRFEKESWESLMQDWNQQNIFKFDKISPVRDEKNYDRMALSHALKNWSLGIQDNLLPKLASLPMPILYIAGQQDSLYSSLATICSESNKNSHLWIAPEAGHRVPWQQPILFQEKLSTFLRGI